MNRVGTGRGASAQRRAGRSQRAGSSETAVRNQRQEGDVTTRTAASAVDGADEPDGRTGEPELDSASRCREQRGWNRRHHGGGGSSTSREPAAREPPPLAGRRRGLRVPERFGGVAGRDGLRAGSERGTPEGRVFGPGRPGGLRKRGCPRTAVDRGSSGGRGSKPHGREWLKQVTGSGGDQAVKVAKNGEGGRRGRGTPRRGRLSSAPDSFEARRSRPGHGSPGLGASEGRETPREDGRAEHPVVVNRAGGTDEVEVEVLEGERKAMSGEPIAQATARWPLAGTRQGPPRKGKGRRRSRESETNRLRTAVTR